MPSTTGCTPRRFGVPGHKHENVRDPHRRLRVGFVSHDFGRHPVGYFLIRVLENLGRAQWEIICYCDHIVKNDLDYQRFQAAATSGGM